MLPHLFVVTPKPCRRAEAVVAMGGTVSAEHGIGKLKLALLGLMQGADGIRGMRALKRLFDPAWRLNPGNLFEEEPTAAGGNTKGG